MNVEELALLLYIRRKRKLKRKRKQWWIHPYLADRTKKGQFINIYEGLRRYPDKFFNYVRMSMRSFDELLTLCRYDLLKQDTILRKSVSPEEKLFVTLRYFASGCTMRELHYNYRLGQTTLSTIIKEVCAVIWDKLQTCLSLPASASDWIKTADDFEKHSNFPHCLGSIDGKHIRLIQPADSGSLCYNYKHFFSMVLLAVCDANYNFMYIDVGAYGKSSDSAIFQETDFYKKLMSNTLNIPEPLQISENSTTLFPYVFVGDEAFGLSTNVMRPFGGNNLSVDKKIFNYRLSRARRYIECTFGILTNKWRIFHRPLNVHTELAKSIVRTCCVSRTILCVLEMGIHMMIL
ncbi:unnamed protein product [Acanthoscelides obtectus]|uniref:DDE Tnp4 domain-containing protein n=2 Tax=Acanthoscelides obtectus TaxID=200917 RepID=A0A9P0P6N2_ACAOB|nr:unnamed protein product [Acanthoscelides obtectus]CAK1635233.1 Protein ALP1-like [Acanthoscelides obtectus]